MEYLHRLLEAMNQLGGTMLIWKSGSAPYIIARGKKVFLVKNSQNNIGFINKFNFYKNKFSGDNNFDFNGFRYSVHIEDDSIKIELISKNSSRKNSI